MIGIYKFTNKINGKVYIGQSVNIKQRVGNHKSAAYNENANDYNSQFHQAIRKYGIGNFDFEILEEINSEKYSKEDLDELEKQYIEQYNSYHSGYNATPGGDGSGKEGKGGSLNGRALLTENDVEYIRECYNAHIPFRTVYAEYKDKITHRGLQKIWRFETWPNIHPEYHNEENKYWHSHQGKANSSEVAANNKRGFTNEEVIQMRKEYDNGVSPKNIWKKYGQNKVYSTIYNILIRKTYKDVK